MNQSMETNRHEMPDRPKTPYEQRWDAMSDLQKMQLQAMINQLINQQAAMINQQCNMINYLTQWTTRN